MAMNEQHSAGSTETLDSLRKAETAARQKIWKLEAAQRYETAKELVGNCYRYRNSYSCPDGEKDRWWLYMRVTEVAKDGWLTVFSFQTDKDGQITIEPEKRKMHESNLGEPITLKEFQFAWTTLAKKVSRAADKVRAQP